VTLRQHHEEILLRAGSGRRPGTCRVADRVLLPALAIFIGIAVYAVVRRTPA
jgi:hypothetical protein